MGEQQASDASSEEFDEYSGCKLTLKVVEAQDVIAADRGGTSDPFARITFGGHSRQTGVKKKTLYPVWNETFEYEVENVTNKIVVEVFDHDIFSQEFLGMVEIPVSMITIEAVQDTWYSLEPRQGFSDVVSGQLHLVISITPKTYVATDLSGLEAHTWLDLAPFKEPAGERDTYSIRMYFATTYADFQDELAALEKDVFPDLSALCGSEGYTFTPVVMRTGMDERMDRMYQLDPRVPPLHLREIQACRKISPRVNFFAFMGERYGSSPLPLSLDRNEFMAVRGALEADEELWQELEMLEQWCVTFPPWNRPTFTANDVYQISSSKTWTTESSIHRHALCTWPPPLISNLNPRTPENPKPGIAWTKTRSQIGTI